MKRRGYSLRAKKKVAGILFVSPWIIGVLLFFFQPIFMSIRLSFSNIVKITGLKMEWIGFENYRRAFVTDINFIPIFLEVIRNTLLYTPLILVFSLLIAILVNKKIALRGFFRGVFFLPVLLGTGFIMQQLLGQDVDAEAMEVARGILLPDRVLLYLGPRIADVIDGFFDMITMVLWKSGVQILLFLAGLQGIPISLYESARVDSATEWEMFWKITLPNISPVLLLNAVYTIIDSFTESINPMVEYVLGIAFEGWQLEFEYGAALGWIYLLFVALFVGLAYRVLRVYEFRAGDR